MNMHPPRFSDVFRGAAFRQEGWNRLIASGCDALTSEAPPPVNDEVSECSPCRDVLLNYSELPLFQGGNTGSIPVLNANIFKHS
jgi:hypothetical protein